MKNCLTFLFLISIAFPAAAQSPGGTRSKQVNRSFDLNGGNVYTFEATYMYPMKGRPRNLTPSYTLIFSKDTLNGYLPYFGTVTYADYGSRNGGVTLGTNNFTCTRSEDKKGDYELRYKLNGSNDVTDITFHIYKNGTADVRFRFLQRESIAYRGTVKEQERP